MKSKILVWLCLGLVFGAFLHFTCHIGTEKKDVSNTVKDRIVYMNVDELRVKARNGDKSAYKYLKEYFHRKGHSEEIFYYAMVNFKLFFYFRHFAQKQPGGSPWDCAI